MISDNMELHIYVMHMLFLVKKMDFETIFLACFQSNMRVPLVSDHFTHGVVSISVHCNTTPLRIKKNDQ